MGKARLWAGTLMLKLTHTVDRAGKLLTKPAASIHNRQSELAPAGIFPLACGKRKNRPGVRIGACQMIGCGVVGQTLRVVTDDPCRLARQVKQFSG